MQKRSLSISRLISLTYVESMTLKQRHWWQHIWKDHKVLRTAFWLFIYFLTKIRPGESRLVITYKQMLRETGVSKPTIYTWLERLQDYGYLRVEQSNNCLVIRVNKLPKGR